MGATLTIRAQGQPLEVTIASVEEDPDATGGRVLLHRFLVKDARAVGQISLCTPDAARAVTTVFQCPMAAAALRSPAPAARSATCIRWGYRPWEEQPGGPPARCSARAYTWCAPTMAAMAAPSTPATAR